MRLASICVLAVLCIPSLARAQDLDRAMKALTMISEFADKICNNPDLRGKASSVNVQGKAKAEASKLVKQLADLKVEGAAGFSASDYEGLLQKDLLPALQDSTKCKQRIYDDLKDRFLPPKQSPRSENNFPPDTAGATDRPKSEGPPASPRQSASHTIFGLRFVESDCSVASERRVTCSFTISNQNASTELGIQFGGCCLATDQRGNTVRLVHASIANQDGAFTQYTGYVRAPLVQDVPTIVTFTFQDFPTGVTQISLLQLRLKLSGAFREITVRDIPTNRS